MTNSQTHDADPEAVPTAVRFTDDDRSRWRKIAGGLVLALIPLSALAALIVLSQMAANSAAATGGCGGG
jgi:hypothetical protein